MAQMNGLDKTAHSLLVIGGLNWGIVALFNKDIVSEIFGYGSTLADIVFIIIGLAAVYSLVGIVKMMQEESKKSAS